jgi:tetratricopeptide (TPR) repeat protein
VAVESGLIAGVLLFALGGLWLREALRGARSMPADTVLLRAGVVAAFLASAAHNVVDSDLYYAGSGFGLFLLMGAGLALFGDALTPEQPHRLTRVTALISAAIAVATGIIAAHLDLAKANALWLRERGDFDGAIERIDSVSLLDALDGEVPAIRAALVPPESRLAHLRRAARIAPSPKNLRALARELASREQYSEAERALREALTLDPNNLLALSQLLALQVEMASPISAEQTARRLVAVEESPYYRVRAIPEIVPTETLAARLFLATREPDAARKIELLEPAVRGYVEYLDRTLPMIRNGLAETPPVFVPGERPEQASKRLLDGAAAADLLAAAYRTSGMEREAVESATRLLACVKPRPRCLSQTGRPARFPWRSALRRRCHGPPLPLEPRLRSSDSPQVHTR